MISHVRTPVGLKPTWKGNLLLLLVAMLISACITFCLVTIWKRTRPTVRDRWRRLNSLPALNDKKRQQANLGMGVS
jgi:hypothetical protein